MHPHRPLMPSHHLLAPPYRPLLPCVTLLKSHHGLLTFLYNHLTPSHHSLTLPHQPLAPFRRRLMTLGTIHS